MSYKEYQPLRVSGDWTFEWNCFFEVDPTEDMVDIAENLLYITSEKRKRAIELQWKPEDDPKGEFVLKVINLQEEYNETLKTCFNSGDWGNPHIVFTSKKRIEIVEKIEYLMFFLEAYIDDRIFKSRGIIDDELEALRIEFLSQKTTKEIIKKICESNNSTLQNLLIDSKKIDKETLLFLKDNGAKKGIKNKASQKLKSKSFR